MKSNRVIPKYQNTADKLSLFAQQANLKRIQQFPELARYYTTDGMPRDQQHYEPATGLNNPFYDAFTDTYGTYQLPEVPVTHTFNSEADRQSALHRAEGRKGGRYVREARRQVTPYIAPIAFAPAAMALQGYGLLQPMVDLAFVASDPANPINYVPYISKAKQLVKSAELVKNAEQRLPAVKESVMPVNKTSEGERYTKLIMDFLKHNQTPVTKPRNDAWFGSSKALLDYLAGLGVDVSKLTPSDIIKLKRARAMSVFNNLPKNGEVILKSDRSGPIPSYQYLLSDYEHDGYIDLPLGELTVYHETPYSHIDMVETYHPGHDTSEKLYNEAIRDSEGGLVSGEVLLSPEITVNHVWPKYKDKALLNNTGRHYYGHGEYVNNAITEAQGREVIHDVLDDQPVMLLKSPSDLPPLKVKYTSRFHPDMIDEKTFTFKPPDWNNPNPYMSIIPGAIIGGELYDRQ